MYKIALVCENGASTGMVVRKMREAAKKTWDRGRNSSLPIYTIRKFY